MRAGLLPAGGGFDAMVDHAAHVERSRRAVERDLTAAGRAEAIAAVEAAYETAGVTRFAAWVHETDGGMRSDLERRGYACSETTRAETPRS